MSAPTEGRPIAFVKSVVVGFAFGVVMLAAALSGILVMSWIVLTTIEAFTGIKQ